MTGAYLCTSAISDREWAIVLNVFSLFREVAPQVLDHLQSHFRLYIAKIGNISNEIDIVRSHTEFAVRKLFFSPRPPQLCVS